MGAIQGLNKNFMCHIIGRGESFNVKTMPQIYPNTFEVGDKIILTGAEGNKIGICQNSPVIKHDVLVITKETKRSLLESIIKKVKDTVSVIVVR